MDHQVPTESFTNHFIRDTIKYPVFLLPSSTYQVVSPIVLRPNIWCLHCKSYVLPAYVGQSGMWSGWIQAQRLTYDVWPTFLAECAFRPTSLLLRYSLISIRLCIILLDYEMIYCIANWNGGHSPARALVGSTFYAPYKPPFLLATWVLLLRGMCLYMNNIFLWYLLKSSFV